MGCSTGAALRRRFVPIGMDGGHASVAALFGCFFCDKLCAFERWKVFFCEGIFGAHNRLVVTESIGEKGDRKSTRLNSSHVATSYAVFCLKKQISRQHLLC